MSFWRVADSSPNQWAEQRSRTEPRSAAIAELISVLAGVGLDKAQTIVDKLCLQTSLFSQYAAWNRFREVTALELQALGLTVGQAAKVMAGIEFGKRVFAAQVVDDRPMLDSPEVVASLLRYELGYSPVERFAVVVLDARHYLKATEVVTVGSRHEVLAPPSEIFGTVLRSGGCRFLVAHCHPSGALEPSMEDLALTRQLLQTSQMLGIPLLDHLILAGDRHCSLRQTTSLWVEHPQGV